MDMTTVIISVLSSILSSGIVVFILESRRQDRENHNAKVEEFYLCVHKWQGQVTSYWLANINWMAGKLDINQMNDLIIERAKESNSYERIVVLLDVYFPSVKHYFELARKYTDTAGEIYGNARKLHEANGAYKDILPIFIRSTTGFEDAVNNVKAAIVRLKK